MAPRFDDITAALNSPNRNQTLRHCCSNFVKGDTISAKKCNKLHRKIPAKVQPIVPSSGELISICTGIQKENGPRNMGVFRSWLFDPETPYYTGPSPLYVCVYRNFVLRCRSRLDLNIKSSQWATGPIEHLPPNAFTAIVKLPPARRLFVSFRFVRNSGLRQENPE